MIARSGIRRLQPAQAFTCAVGGDHVVAVGGEVIAEEGAGGVVVLDDEDGGAVSVRHADQRPQRRDSLPASAVLARSASARRGTCASRGPLGGPRLAADSAQGAAP